MNTVYLVYSSFIKCLDNLCCGIDKIIDYISNIKKEVSESDEVDEKFMFEAELEQLRSENKKLKKLYYPKKMLYDEQTDNYICPNCNEALSKMLIENSDTKYCNCCGKRIYRDKKVSNDGEMRSKDNVQEK